jgi:hypothetical protein
VKNELPEPTAVHWHGGSPRRAREPSSTTRTSTRTDSSRPDCRVPCSSWTIPRPTTPLATSC